jgi:hypothetical protein
MSSIACSFCAHRNPEDSRFCNECGAPLHLVPCGHCQAVNHVRERHCYRCGEVLATLVIDSPADEPLPRGDAAAEQVNASDESVENAEIAEARGDVPAPGSGLASAAAGDAPQAEELDDSTAVEVEPFVPQADPSVVEALRATALAGSARAAAAPTAEPLEPQTPATPALPPIVAEDPPTHVQAGEPDAADLDDGSFDAPPLANARYERRARYAVHAVVLAVLFVGIAAAMYWTSRESTSTQRDDARAEPAVVTAQPRNPADAPAASASPRPAASSDTGLQAPAPAQQPAPVPESQAPSTAPSSASRPEPVARPPAPVEPQVAQGSAEPDQAATPHQGGRSHPATTQGKGLARGKSEPAKPASAHVRTREEAERDALATQRVVARSLGNAAPAEPAGAPEPR